MRAPHPTSLLPAALSLSRSRTHLPLPHKNLLNAILQSIIESSADENMEVIAAIMSDFVFGNL